MRKCIVGAVFLVGTGLALFFLLRMSGLEGASASRDGEADSGQAEARVKRPGMVPLRESPKDLGVRGSAEPGSTPPLAQLPSEQDGVLEVEVLADGQPSPNASVRLYRRGPWSPSRDQVSWQLESTGTTDEQGHARLATRAGRYQVAVRAQGYGTLLRDVMRPQGEARTLVSLSLEPGQSLAGRTVEEGSQDPLPLVEVRLTARGHEVPPEERAYATSDARGNFRVEGLPRGEYRLEARAEGYALASQEKVKVPAAGPLTIALSKAGIIEGFVVDSAGGPAAGAEVQVSGAHPQTTTAGPRGGFSLEVEPGRHLVSARRGAEAGSFDSTVFVEAGGTVSGLCIQLGQGGTLEGRVIARGTRAPVAGASVEVSPSRRKGDAGHTVTDGSGGFSMGGLAPGIYDLEVSAPGFSLTTRKALAVAAGERFPVEILLTGTGALEGQVRDGTGQPVPRAQVFSHRWDGAPGRSSFEARTNTQGSYRLEGLTVGPTTVTARREGELLAATGRGDVTEGGTTRVDLTLEDTGTVEGVVRVVRGALPAEPLRVNVYRQGLGRFGGRSGLAEVDAAGRFRLVLPAGTYELRAHMRRENRLPPPKQMQMEAKQVQVEAGKTVQTELSWEPPAETSDEPPAETYDGDGIRGIVLEPDGSPSLGATVMMSHEGSGMTFRSVSTDSTGHFSISFRTWEEATAMNRVRLLALNGGRTGEVQGVKPGDESVVVRLGPEASVRGRVVRASGGAPVKGFTVTVESSGSWEFPGDRFELRDVPTGTVNLLVKTGDGAAGKAQVSTSSGAVAEVVVTVKALAGVRGRVVDATTQTPLVGARALLHYTQDYERRTDSNGRFTWEQVMPGQYWLWINHGLIRSHEGREVTLAEGQMLEVGDIAVATMRTQPGTIGMIMKREGTWLVIQELFLESPAASAGLQPGDVLLTVDGAAVTQVGDAMRRLAGAPGSAVVITVWRADSERSVSVTRAP